MPADNSSAHHSKQSHDPDISLAPGRPIVVVYKNKTELVQPSLIARREIGCKAFGLSCLPLEWVPSFFVVTANCLDALDLSGRIEDAARKAGVTASTVIVRSNGTSETMENRGQFASKPCAIREISSTLKELRSNISECDLSEIHWIIQTYLPPRRKGHLSNERHLVYENRDWVAEVEIQGDRNGYATKIGVRSWREGRDISEFDLSCVSEPQMTLQLRRVARWATASMARIHFEWVWEGTRLWIVQADIADPTQGTDPTRLLPAEVPSIAVSTLSAFKVAARNDFSTYGKLRNAQIYSELGYEMPRFYVLDDQSVLGSLLSGNVAPSLDSDLVELTRRPLIIRTDGLNIPKEKKEMLPRSDELRSPEEAKIWLLETFRAKVESGGLQSASLCLIAHHFIPSVASAWARAEPGKRMVRIESLWGLPEGLYWYSHDTFEVDTQGVVPISRKANYSYWKRLRYKGTFVAPDSTGRWVPYRTDASHDRRPSITRKKWIQEIASTTRLIADREKKSTAVMWFIDNDKRATRHTVLPWFHSPSDLGEGPKASPRNKLSISRDFRIERQSDWTDLQHAVNAGRRIERVVVKPTDPFLIRNREFAEDLAQFAAKNNIVVELAGGVLSHAYYVLQRNGAQVECIDLFGADEEVVEYNKVVRDKVPDVIENRGEKVEIVQLTGDALLAGLRQKLVEEAYEALDAVGGDDLIAELADMQEVLNAIASALHLAKGEVEKARIEKSKKRGGFERGYMLRRTATPRSLSTAASIEHRESSFPLDPLLSITPVISNADEIPINAPYRRPDLRNLEQETEKLFAFATELNRVGTAKESTSFELPLDGEKHGFTLTLEFSRTGAAMRGNVRLRVRPKQLSLPVSDAQLPLDFSEDSPNS